MNLKIDQNYTITSDTYNIVLTFEEEGEINPKTGNPVLTKRESFHPNLRQALEKYKEDSLKKCQSVEDILNKLDEVKTVIENITF